MRRMYGVVLVILMVTRAVHAQTTAAGSVRGVATDEHGSVVPGVAVIATSATVPGVFTATTDMLGQYRLGDLPPGDYTVIADLAGFARFLRTPVTVRAGLNVEVNIVMKVGAIGETIEVRVETPLLETRNATQAVNISGELLRGVPLSEQREWYGALNLTPGVTVTDFSGTKMFYVHGADQAANIVQIDGADVSLATNSSVSSINLNIDAVDDMQIKTGGVDASSPLGIGGIVNIATASGTNQLRGAVAFAAQPRRWNGSNNPGGTSSTVDQRQVDVSIGAPVVKDRLWAVGAYRYVDVTTGISRTAAQLATLQALVKDYKPFDSTNEAQFWIAKLTAQPAAAHHVTAFYQRDVNPVSTALATVVNPNKQWMGGAAASLRLSSVWSSHLTTRAGASYNDKRRGIVDIGVKGPFQRVFQSTILSGGRLAGNGQLATLQSPITALVSQPNSKTVFSFDATVFARHGSSTHELQAGVYTQRRVQGNDVTYVNDGFTIEDTVRQSDGALVPFHRQIMETTHLTSFRQRGWDYAAYVQDAWRPSSRLTVSAGVRVDYITARDLVFQVTSQNSTEVGPRFGVNYSLTADARNVVKAHWVRVHDQPGIVAPVGTATVATRDLYDLNLDGTFETVFVTPATLTVTPNQSIDRALHQPSVKEWGAGYSRQLRGGISASADFVRRRFVDRPTLVEINGDYRGNVFVGYKDPGFNEIYIGTNNRWNTPVYNSLELSITKRTSRVQGIASYVKQWRHIDGSWQPNDPASFLVPNAFPNDKGIGSTTGTLSGPTDANSLSGTHMAQGSTGSAQWVDHCVRSGLTYSAPWGIVAAASYTLQSGIWSGPIVSRLAAADPAFGPTLIALPNGRIVTNPLSTIIRFAYPTRGEGQLKTPNLHVLNLRVGRRFELRRLKLDASLDAFNVTNHDADLRFQSGSNQTYNPLFGTTTSRQLPRSAQVMLRTSF